jgi:hypothetical protein
LPKKIKLLIAMAFEASYGAVEHGNIEESICRTIILPIVISCNSIKKDTNGFGWVLVTVIGNHHGRKKDIKQVSYIIVL